MGAESSGEQDPGENRHSFAELYTVATNEQQ